MTLAEQKLAIAQAVGLTTDRLSGFSIDVSGNGFIEIKATYVLTDHVQVLKLQHVLQSIEFKAKTA